MIMIFLLPLMIIGVLLGIIAGILMKTKKITLSKFSIWLHRVDVFLVILAAISVFYIYFLE